MLEKLGKKALLAPFFIGIVLCCVLSLAVSPLLRANPNNVSFAIVNLDKGATTVAGSSNIGETLTENLISGESSLTDDDENDSGSSVKDAINWTQLESKDELDHALAENSYYGGIVIPSNFTSQQISSAVGLSNAPELEIYLNKGKNPQMASTMQTTLQAAMLKAGISCKVEMVNDATLGDGTMSDTMAVQMLVMPLFMMTMICSIITSLLFWHKDVTGLRKRNQALAALLQFAFVVVISAAVAGLALFVDSVAGGLTLPLLQLFLLCWGSSLCCMACFVGLCDIALPLGALIAISTFALGMGTAILGPEMLPSFWADWIYPWAPQAHIGNGVRTIIYFGHIPNANDLIPIACFGIAGLVAFLLAAVLPSKAKREKTTPQQQTTTNLSQKG